MALDYLQSANLRTNAPFQSRIASAALHWADFIMGGSVAAGDPKARNELAYAQTIYQNSSSIAATLQPLVVSDAAVQSSNIDATYGSDITDANLQTVVETAIGKLV